MTQHLFFSCDICNPMGARIPEQRRDHARYFREGRRNLDGRAWFEGTEAQAIECGWDVTDDGRHICPDCRCRGLSK